MFESLGLDPAIDFATVETLGNTGAVALPVTMAIGVEQGRLRPLDHVAMLGIGSGINCLMLAVEWKSNPRNAANKSAKAVSLAGASG
jgi:3-oxoacyl-[acyl-carrier-protein] synthase-3